MTRVVKIDGQRLVCTGYLLIIVPLLVFFFGWMKWYLALLAALILLFGFFTLYWSDLAFEKRTLSIPLKHLIAVVALLSFWVLMSGNCGFGYGLEDIPWRNALFRDLINYDWPVVYANGSALAYYFALWLVPALVGKVLGWGAALAALWLYETVIVVTAVLLVALLLDARSVSTFWMIAVVFMLWSGLNLVGSAVMEIVGHNEYGFALNGNEAYCDVFFYGEATNFYYRSNFNVIAEVYNQMVFWIAVPLMMLNRRMRSFIYLDVLMVLYSPWALVGLIPFMVFYGVLELRDEKARRLRTRAGELEGSLPRWTLRQVFSPANCCGLLVLVPLVIFLYAGVQLTANGHVTSAATGAGSFGFLTVSAFNAYNWMGYVLFVVCEFLVFAALIFKMYRRDPLYWVTVISLMLIPFIWVGNISGRDFCMDASLPALFVLMILMMRYLKDDLMGKDLDFRRLATLVMLTVAFASPLMQMAQDVVQVRYNLTLWTIDEEEKYPYTYEGQPVDVAANFVAEEPSSTLFFSTLAR